jgi:hypothetical protein
MIKSEVIRARTYAGVKSFVRRYAENQSPRQTESWVLNKALREFFLAPERRREVAALGDFQVVRDYFFFNKTSNKGSE